MERGPPTPIPMLTKLAYLGRDLWHGYALTAQCFNTRLLRSCALWLGGALEWPTQGLTGAEGVGGGM